MCSTYEKLTVSFARPEHTRQILLPWTSAHGRSHVREKALQKAVQLLLAGKTLEVRRSEAGGDKVKGSSPRDLERLFLVAQQDRHRPCIGLSPLPMPVPPPPPPSQYASTLICPPSHRLSLSTACHVKHDPSSPRIAMLGVPAVFIPAILVLICCICYPDAC